MGARVSSWGTGKLIHPPCPHPPPLPPRWGQVYILQAMRHVLPLTHEDAELLAERISFRLQHANYAVVFAAVGAVVYFMHYMAREAGKLALLRKLGTSLGRACGAAGRGPCSPYAHDSHPTHSSHPHPHH